MIDGNDTLYIVDWDDPIIAPKERDLMFIGGGVANVWNERHEEVSFYRGMEPLKSIRHYWPITGMNEL